MRALKTYDHMIADSLIYLAENTDITYLSEGSVARSLVEATMLEIAKVQEYIAAGYANVFINSATGTYLDLIGEMVGTARLTSAKSSVSAEDKNIKFSVVSGVLRDKFPHPTDSTLGQIPAGIIIQTSDGAIKFITSAAITFPGGATEVFVSAEAEDYGSIYNIGKYRLNTHDGPSGVSVTNLYPISNGGSEESDANYRYRLSNIFAAAPSSNATSIRLAVAGIPDVSRVILNEYSRGAGTFDAMLIPIGNKVSSRARSLAQAAVNHASAFGVSAFVTEPSYLPFKITIQLIPANGATAGTVDVNRISAKNAVLNYMETIPIGGELIINRLRAAVIDSVISQIKDIKIIDICLEGRSRVIRNYQLERNQLFTPDTESGSEAVVIV